ncbi:cytosolic factor, phosphatidylinositol/phosphatidylcholine transfer protein [Cytospora paraplurivora]|uniref:Cytosolic factor, phosphatidylinositol/phosphatidylcholine transfer protein n=1 Tax=Cytospora paraplurivora TaxID=2898453 RepID=A0AAN9YC10_9PEZI
MAAPQATEGLELNPKYDDYDFPVVAPVKASGHPGHLTPDQIEKVQQFRESLEKQGYTDRLDTLTLLRFLRARKFDLVATEKMFVDAEKWRKDTKLDEILPEWDYPEKEQIFKYYPQYYHKTDNDGRPVYIEQLGNVDIAAINKITTSERMLTNLAVEYERVADPRLPACSRKAGHLLETCCTIMDLKGVGLSKAPSVYGYLKSASNMSQNYYPERLGKLFVINAPWGFAAVWSAIKGWIDPVTVQKIHILGSGYQKELLQHVPADSLPKVFGGTCECPGGCMFSDLGPWKEPEFARTPKWAKKAGDATIQNQQDDPQQAHEAQAPVAEDATADAHAPAAA